MKIFSFENIKLTSSEQKVLSDIQLHEVQNIPPYLQILLENNNLITLAGGVPHTTVTGDRLLEAIKDERKEFLFKSVAMPIAVSFVTAAITSVAIPLLLSWLQQMLALKP